MGRSGREVEAGTTDTEVIRRTVEVMKGFNVTGVISAPQRGGATTTLTWSLLLIVMSLVYLSARSAIIGSTRDARRAGIRQATSDTTVMTSVVPTSVAR